MNELNQKPKNGQFAVHEPQRLITINGILTSRIETREKNNQPYYYGFFQVPDQDQEIPVIFKTKPEIPKGSQVELTGNWAKSNGNRPSFTCYDYELAKRAKEVFHG